MFFCEIRAMKQTQLLILVWLMLYLFPSVQMCLQFKICEFNTLVFLVALRAKQIQFKRLTRHIISSLLVRSKVQCVSICIQTQGCLSVNVVIGGDGKLYSCELSNVLASSHAEDLIDSSNSLYYYLADIDNCGT